MKITDELISEFADFLIDEEKSAATIEKYIRDIRKFSLWVVGKELTKRTVLYYKEYLGESYAPASVNSVLSSLNSFFEYTEWHNLKVKMLKIQKRIFAPKDRELTKEEYERLLCAAKQRGNKKLYYILQTICSCGIRVSELKEITVEAVKKKEAVIRCKGKMRVILLPGALCKMLTVYIKEERILTGAVFVTRNGRELDRSTIWKMMKSLCECANVESKKVFPHNLRHLFARTYYAIQKDIVRLADILGHSSINTTRIYTMETGDIHRMHIQKLGLVYMHVPMRV